jgi:hypothetical protein
MRVEKQLKVTSKPIAPVGPSVYSGPAGQVPEAQPAVGRADCAALDRAARAPFRKERRMKCDSAIKFYRKSGGA